MLIPRLLYGRYSEVKARSAKVVTALARGRSWEEAFGTTDLVDTATTPGLVVVDGPSPLVGGAPHFNCYVPWKQLPEAIWKGRIAKEQEEQLFERSLAAPWSLLGLFGQHPWIWPEHRRRPFLHAALAAWNEIASVGPRFSDGSNDGSDLWSVANTIKFVLANMGLSNDTLRAPLPPGGLAALVAIAERRSPA